MKALNPYLNFPGTAEEAFTLYRSVFGGEFSALQRFGDSPEAERTPKEHRNKLMHIALPLPGGTTTLMATDALEAMGHSLTVGDNIQLSIEAESTEEVTRLYTALSAGGQASMPPADTFWGAYFAMCTDKYGVRWMLNFTKPPEK